MTVPTRPKDPFVCRYCHTSIKFQKLNASVSAASCQKKNCVHEKVVHVRIDGYVYSSDYSR